MKSLKTKSLPLAGLFLTLAVGLYFRISHSKDQWLWLDEYVQLETSRLPFTQMLQQLLMTDVHPPGFFLITQLWISMFGEADFTLRLLPIILSVLALFASYHFLRTRFEEIPALIGATFLFLSPPFVFYSIEFRCYSSLLLGSFLLLIGMDWIGKRSHRMASVLIFVGTFLTAFSHLSGLLVFFTLMFWRFGLRKWTLNNLTVFLPSLVLSLATVAIQFEQSQRSAVNMQWSEPRVFYEVFWLHLEWLFFPEVLTVPILAALLLSAVFRPNRQVFYLGLTVLLIPALFYTGVSEFYIPIYHRRFALVGLVGATLLVVNIASTSFRRRRWPATALCMVVILTQTFYMQEFFESETQPRDLKGALQIASDKPSIPIVVLGFPQHQALIKRYASQVDPSASPRQVLLFSKEKISEIEVHSPFFLFDYSGLDIEKIAWRTYPSSKVTKLRDSRPSVFLVKHLERE